MLSGQDAMQGTRVFWRVIPGAKQDIQERVRAMRTVFGQQLKKKISVQLWLKKVVTWCRAKKICSPACRSLHPLDLLCSLVHFVVQPQVISAGLATPLSQSKSPPAYLRSLIYWLDKLVQNSTSHRQVTNGNPCG